ncbi:MAG: glycosyltransferase, partial [Alphaproteobacteria bacterium]|nr:glycosyltransferase [Alphaproteobacteria bacterium]
MRLIRLDETIQFKGEFKSFRICRFIWGVGRAVPALTRKMRRVESLKRLMKEWTPWMVGPAHRIRNAAYIAVTLLRRPNFPDDDVCAVLIDNHVHDETRRTVWIISFTGVSNEPRVLRQARALIDTGWRVVVLGYDGHSTRPEDWIFVRLPNQQAYSPFRFQFMRLTRAIGQGLYRFMSGKIRDAGARLYFNNIPNWAHIRAEGLRVARDHPELAPDLIAVHDYFTSPLGADLAEYFGAKLSVDCHEYAAGQYMHDPEWVKKTRPWVMSIQNDYLRRADLVTTVSDGIAERLNEEHALKRPVQVVRSVPIRQPQRFKPTGEQIAVLYHGDISYVRGLHKAVKSMPL